MFKAVILSITCVSMYSEGKASFATQLKKAFWSKMSAEVEGSLSSRRQKYRERHELCCF